MKIVKKRQKRGIIKKLAIITLSVFLIFIASFLIYFLKETSGLKLNAEKLVLANSQSNINIYDINGKKIDSSYLFSDKLMVKLDELPTYVKEAFILTEDKRFYKHNGVDYRRVLGALFNNIKKGKVSQGASTISQQLIKNTHLSNEKTVERKLKEIRLAYKLERKYSKDEILELYLNNIYFGNGCYGLENASRFYFNKEAKNLSVGEACMLVGVINAPSYYDPITKNENSEKRKKIVLSLLKNNNIISENEYEKSAKNQEKITKNALKPKNIYMKCIFNEVCKKINITINQLKNMDLNIYTSIDLSLQNYIDNQIKKDVFNPINLGCEKPSIGVMVIDNNTKSIVGISSNKGIDLLNLKRQPGSSIKPILVYSPAIEYGKIYPESMVMDEEININGYKPTNAGGVFYGNVSLRIAIEKSLNIPAVKILSKVGIENAKKFASRMGIEFSSNDNNLALALGGMTEGVTVQDLADAYSALATNGEYSESCLVTKICNKNGRVLYEKNSALKKVMEEETAYLITDLLKGVVKNGTAKRLNVFNFDVASKTGTVGLVGSDKNTDAFNVAYTSSHTIVCWYGALNKTLAMDHSVNGATYPTEFNKSILAYLYRNETPPSFEEPEGIVRADIDIRSFDSKEIQLANMQVPEKYKKSALFDINKMPEIFKYVEAHKTVLEVSMEEGLKPTFKFMTKLDNEYSLYRDNIETGQRDLIYKVVGDDNKKVFIDKFAEHEKIYEYFVISNTIMEPNKTKISNEIKLMSF